GECREVAAHQRHEWRPIETPALAVKPKARIPRTVGPRTKPAPIGIEGQEGPCGPAEGTREVKDRGVDRDQEIEAGQGYGCVGKVAKMRCEVGNLARQRTRLQFRCTDTWTAGEGVHLQTEEFHVRDVEERRQGR